MIRVEANTPLIEERNKLLRRLDELNAQIDKNAGVYRTEIISEVGTMADEEQAEKAKMSIPERFAATKKLIDAGKKNSEIATELGISVAYVYNVRTGKTVLKDKTPKEKPVKAKK